jgi:hypothetical protein
MTVNEKPGIIFYYSNWQFKGFVPTKKEAIEYGAKFKTVVISS